MRLEVFGKQVVVSGYSTMGWEVACGGRYLVLLPTDVMHARGSEKLVGEAMERECGWDKRLTGVCG